jgi:hypothetical protein
MRSHSLESFSLATFVLFDPSVSDEQSPTVQQLPVIERCLAWILLSGQRFVESGVGISGD